MAELQFVGYIEAIPGREYMILPEHCAGPLWGGWHLRFHETAERCQDLQRVHWRYYKIQRMTRRLGLDWPSEYSEFNRFFAEQWPDGLRVIAGHYGDFHPAVGSGQILTSPVTFACTHTGWVDRIREGFAAALTDPFNGGRLG